MLNPQDHQQQQQQQQQREPPIFALGERVIDHIQSLPDHLKPPNMKFQVDQTLFQTGKS